MDDFLKRLGQELEGWSVVSVEENKSREGGVCTLLVGKRERRKRVRIFQSLGPWLEVAHLNSNFPGKEIFQDVEGLFRAIENVRDLEDDEFGNLEPFEDLPSRELGFTDGHRVWAISITGIKECPEEKIRKAFESPQSRKALAEVFNEYGYFYFKGIR